MQRQLRELVAILWSEVEAGQPRRQVEPIELKTGKLPLAVVENALAVVESAEGDLVDQSVVPHPNGSVCVPRCKSFAVRTEGDSQGCIRF